MFASTLAAVLILYLAWILGANSVSLAMPMATPLLTFRRAAALISLMCFAGVFFFGDSVLAVVSHGIVADITVGGALAIGIGSALWLTLSTWKGMPISSTHTIVGAILGYGLALGHHIDYAVLGGIATAWLLSPVLGLLCGLIAYTLVRSIFAIWAKGLRQKETLELVFTYLYILAACLLAFSLGANALATAVGAMSGAYTSRLIPIEIIATAAICIGILTWGKKIVGLVDQDLTELTPSRGFCALFTTALLLLFFSRLGSPISVIHTLVGSIVGVGLARGLNQINKKTFDHVFFTWLVTLPLSALLGALIALVVP